MYTIKKITFDEILPVWRNKLWPDRESKIEPNSAMCFYKQNKTHPDLDHIHLEKYDLRNMETEPTFWGAYDGNKLIGVNSGHMCFGKMYRSRGLYVDPDYRHAGLGKKLLLKTIAQGVHEGAILVWSFPKLDVWNKVYKKVDFQITSHSWNFRPEVSETGVNIRAAVIINEKIVNNLTKEALCKLVDEDVLLVGGE